MIYESFKLLWESFEIFDTIFDTIFYKIHTSLVII